MEAVEVEAGTEALKGAVEARRLGERCRQGMERRQRVKAEARGEAGAGPFVVCSGACRKQRSVHSEENGSAT